MQCYWLCSCLLPANSGFGFLRLIVSGIQGFSHFKNMTEICHGRHRVQCKHPIPKWRQFPQELSSTKPKMYSPLRRDACKEDRNFPFLFWTCATFMKNSVFMWYVFKFSCFQVFMFSVFIWYAVTHAIWDLSVWNSTVSLNNSKCSKLTDSEDELQRTESRKYKSGHVLMTLQVSQMCSRQKAGRENTFFCIFGTGKIVRNGWFGEISSCPDGVESIHLKLGNYFSLPE